MKRILVPTDFSKIADNATTYAIGLANAFKSSLYLYHFYTIDRFNYDYNFPKDKQPFVKEVSRKMELTKWKFNHKIEQKAIPFRAVVEEGNFISKIKEKVRENGIHMIVMGSKGASASRNIVFGRIAASAVNHAEIPVLIIPPGCSFNPFKQIILAIDHKEIEDEVLAPLRKMAMLFGAEITLLNVNTKKQNTIEEEYVLPVLDGIRTNYKDLPLSKSITETINNYINSKSCDLLCMVKRDDSFFKSLFKSSVTIAQVHKSHIPLLVLPENA